MSKFLRIVALIFTLCMLNLCLSKGLIGINSPTSQGYFELKAQIHNDGKYTCWNNICPGKTPYGEAKKLSETQSILYGNQYSFEIQYSEQIIIQVSNNLGTDSAPIEVISLKFAPYYLTLGDLLILVGNPISVDGRTNIQPMWQKGICFSHGLSAFFQGTSHRIQPSLPIVSLVIGDPTEDSYCSSTEYIPWKGFGQHAFNE